jgi:hypothetical protein
MSTATRQRRTPLGLFPDRPIPRLDDRIIEVFRVRHESRRTEQRRPIVRQPTVTKRFVADPVFDRVTLERPRRVLGRSV